MGGADVGATRGGAQPTEHAEDEPSMPHCDAVKVYFAVKARRSWGARRTRALGRLGIGDTKLCTHGGGLKFVCACKARVLRPDEGLCRRRLRRRRHGLMAIPRPDATC